MLSGNWAISQPWTNKSRRTTAWFWHVERGSPTWMMPPKGKKKKGEIYTKTAQVLGLGTKNSHQWRLSKKLTKYIGQTYLKTHHYWLRKGEETTDPGAAETVTAAVEYSMTIYKTIKIDDKIRDHPSKRNYLKFESYIWNKTHTKETSNVEIKISINGLNGK